ncbi:hypothetical protein G7009_09445 [Pseudomonas capeferrum]|uniref:hypothetical protein n=1 Tax=Pseudomonas capeferrum TaxID=1495066 RepID=UPI0015E2E8E3|nr:hypothetical protein [Pseudomonas capeferrum]MBA1201982.1 hypothetical protein [Pseudomonas capeferrum]
MSLNDTIATASAEQRFRDAFERLKNGATVVLPANSRVSQNNVAKEASCDPSALRKSRFPSLVREIQAYVEIHKSQVPSLRSVRSKLKNKRIDLKKRIEIITQQRDEAHSQLLHVQRVVLDMAKQITALEDELAKIHSQTKP